MKELLVVIDMVNGFVNEGSLADKKINKITPNIIQLIESAKEKGIKIVAFKDCHTMEDKEFEVFPPHCLKGSSESDLIPELKKYEDDMIMIEKNTTNGFETDEFADIIDKESFDKVVVCGCCTDICVNAFVTSYVNYNKENNLNTKLVVVEDACYTFDGKDHNAEEMHKESIRNMEEQGAKIVCLDFLETKEKL